MLAYHYSKGENLEKAYQYLRLSGVKSTRNYSTWEAFHFYKEAIQVLKKEPETEENLRKQVEILQLMTGPMRILGYPEDSLQILEEGERLSKELGDDKSLTIFYGRMGHYFVIKEGKPLLGMEYGERSFERAKKIKDIELTSKTGMDLCVGPYIVSGQYFKIVDVAPKIIDLIEETKKEHELFSGGVNIYSVMQGYYGNSMGWLGNFDEGKVWLEKGLRFASEINDKTSLGYVELLYGGYFCLKGEGKPGIEHSQNAIRYIEEVKFLALLGPAWTQLGSGYHLTGELETARKYIEKGLKIHIDAGFPFLLSTHYWSLSAVYFDSGDLKNAQSCIEEALRLSRDHDEKLMEGCSKIRLGRILGKAEPLESDNAEKYILQGIEISEELKIRPYVAQGYLFLGELYGDAARREKALESLKKAEGMFQEMGMDCWLAQTQEVLGRL